jgi:putative ABC transport system permease protein
MLTAIVKDAVETGLPYSVAYLGVWLVFRLQDDFDLTVGGSFALGASMSATWLNGHGSAWLALLFGALAAAGAGALTFSAMRLLGLSLVLASIVVNLALFSFNLWLMDAPQLQVTDRTVFAQWQSTIGVTDPQVANIALGATIVAVIVAALCYFLKSESGLALRAAGLNQKMVRSVGVSPDRMLFTTIVLGNGLVGFSGGLVAQQQGFSDVNMGLDTIIVGVTAILLGELLLRGRGIVIGGVVAVVLGTVLYRALIAWVLRLGVNPNYFNAITAVAVFGAVGIRRFASVASQASSRLAQTRSPLRPRATQ